MVVLVPGYLELVKVLDAILNEMAQRGDLLAGIHPVALHSGLMGVFEALLRDRLLSSTSKLPASHNDNDIRRLYLYLPRFVPGEVVGYPHRPPGNFTVDSRYFMPRLSDPNRAFLASEYSKIL